MPIEIDAIIAKMEWAARRGLSEFSANAAGTRIQIRRDTGVAPTAAPFAHPVMESSDPQNISTSDLSLSEIAPMAGICHLSSESGTEPFVAVGDVVELGQTICMIEAMKVMTSVTATKSGTIKAILVEDGASVDAGTALFEVQA